MEPEKYSQPQFDTSNQASVGAFSPVHLCVGIVGENHVSDSVRGIFSPSLREQLARKGIAIADCNEGRLAFEKVDCLHLLGTSPHVASIQQQAAKHNVPTIVTPCDWFVGGCPNGMVPWRERLAVGLEEVLYRLGLPRRSLAGRTMRRAAVVGVFSQAESQAYRRRFQVPWRKMMVLPPPVLPPAPLLPFELPFHVQFGVDGYVLCFVPQVGPQLRCLLKAMLGTRIPVVLIASPDRSDKRRSREVLQSLGPLVTVVEPDDLTDSILESAIHSAGALVVLEPGMRHEHWAFRAMAHGVPVVAPAGGIAAEYGGEHVRTFLPNRPAALRRIVVEAWKEGRNRHHVPLPVDPELDGCNAVDAFAVLYRRAVGSRIRRRCPAD
ncbi:hypothetical protein JCM19992_27150 [Thermostilla marina]